MEEVKILALILLIVFYLKNLNIFLFSFKKCSNYKKQIQQHNDNPFEMDFINELTYRADYYDEKCTNAVYNAIALFILGIALMIFI